MIEVYALLTVVSNQESALPAGLFYRHSHLRSAKVVRVLNNLDDTVERLDVELLGAHLRAIEHFP